MNSSGDCQKTSGLVYDTICSKSAQIVAKTCFVSYQNKQKRSSRTSLKTGNRKLNPSESDRFHLKVNLIDMDNIDKSARSCFVGNIPYDATEEQLKVVFSSVGPVLSFKLVFDRDSGKPKGYGFCEYMDPETASSAMRNLNGKLS